MDVCVFFEAEDGIRDLVRSRGLGDVYKRQQLVLPDSALVTVAASIRNVLFVNRANPAWDASIAQGENPVSYTHLTLPTSDLV